MSDFDSDVASVKFTFADFHVDRLCSPTPEPESLSLGNVDSNSRIPVTVRSPSPRLIQKEPSPTAEAKKDHRKPMVKKTRSIPPPPEQESSPRRQHLSKYNSIREPAEAKTDFPIKFVSF